MRQHSRCDQCAFLTPQVFKQPWPGIMRTVYGNHERFETTYFKKFPGYYVTGDGELGYPLPTPKTFSGQEELSKGGGEEEGWKEQGGRGREREGERGGRSGETE